ncbi:MAG: peptidyl-prolyl cis-trans isomerase [Burkholderiales bacterium]|nr:peptidyl-prolyl cis-trans isomerase [Burkholderiales bacterium]
MGFIRYAAAMFVAATFAFSAQAADPKVELKTTAGTIVLELYPDKAPKTVENFLRYVNDGFYKGTIFHRVIPNFMIQGGGFTRDYRQKPTRDPVPNEANNGLHNGVGTIAMARTQDPHSATAQFFINVADNDFLDHKAPNPRGFGYCVFGKVVEGMDVANKIVAMPTGPGGPFPTDAPQTQIVIEDARVLPAN